ncbi:MAG: ABC transporter permease [Lachnospiraceae bacterium]|nr:ABC transporter permease [Lachnospiraceae bacterium]
MNQNLKDFWRYRFLLKELVLKGIRLKYRKSYLGVIWSLIEPLMTTAVLVVVFGTLFNRSSDPQFPVYIMCGRLLFSFFSNGTKGACKEVRRNSSMIKKVYLPKYLYPLSNIIFNYIIFLISLIVLIPVMIYAGQAPTLLIWQVLPALIELFILVVGVGLILSVLDVFFRDAEYLWNVITMIIMYMSAIFYPVDRLEKSGFDWILMYNPLYCIIHQMRGGMLGYYVTAWEYIYPLVVAVIMLVFGVVLFKKKQDDFILYL